MIQAKIENLLKQKIGLSPHSIGSAKIARAIENRRINCNFPDTQSYWEYLEKSPLELQKLVENVTIPETWFFRDQKPFEWVSKYVINQWLPQNFNRELKILSLPCATGEEPYSIVMTLIDFGLDYHQFNIDAIDINQEVLNKAKQGFYTNYSFRQEPFDYRDKYFKKLNHGYQLHSKIRNKVNFQYGNILEPLFLKHYKYDLIFCRNLLIYLDYSARHKVLSILERLLNPSGLLFVGSGETSIVGDRFVSIRQPFTFAYQKKTNPHKSKIKQKPTNIILNSPSETNNFSSQLSINKIKIHPPDNPLVQSRKLANQGELEAAVKICEDYLKNNITNTEAYVLLGEIHEGLGKNEQAEIFYQKAIYLQPTHYEALMHLALLKENKKDFTGAKLIRQRIARIIKQ